MFKRFNPDTGHKEIMVIYFEIINLENNEFKLDYEKFLYMDDFVNVTINQKGILKVCFIWDGETLMLQH